MKERENPSDINRPAKSIVDEVTGEGQAEEAETPDPELRSRIAKILGRLGGLKGGPARAAALTPEERSEIARKAARKRWEKQPKDGA